MTATVEIWINVKEKKIFWTQAKHVGEVNTWEFISV